jgi:S-adenosylmethionine synthetase
MRNIVIEKTDLLPVEQQEIEIIERKCSGHPDTICDAICESVSRELSKEYKKKFGMVLHHNVDKALLVAGSSQPAFGGGKVTTPIKIIVSGRATSKVGNKKVDVKKIVEKAAKEYLKTLHALEEKHYKIVTDINEGSGILKEVFADEMPLSNDTSIGVGYAPFSRAEKIVLDVGNMLTSPEFIKKYPAIGEDIKVMGLRQGKHIKLTICIAFVSKYIKSFDDYYDVRDQVREELIEKTGVKDITINALDKPREEARKIEDLYLHVTGLSAEMGDDGQVGRGNRVNGMITPYREMTLEAAAGKNPTRHVGKIYNVLANIIASDIVKKTGVKEVHIKILSRIGNPIDQPLVVNIQTPYEIGNREKEEMKKVANQWLDDIRDVTEMIIDGKVGIY